MEEQEREELEQVKEENTAPEKKNVLAGMPRRSLVLWVVAGIYLLYTGFKLCKNVIEGAEGGGIGFMLAGVAFLAVGGFFLFYGMKGLYKDDRRRKEQEAAQAEEPEEGAEEVMEDIPSEEPKKKMTISERASLAKRLEEEEAEETEE